MSKLQAIDLSQQLSETDGLQRLAAAQHEFARLRLTAGGQLGGKIGPPLLILFEGWDASGKGGVIKRLVAPLDPRHFTVAQFGPPDQREQRHHFLWRFAPYLPGRGGMVVMDRSWYGRVLVERVEQLASKQQWQRAYSEIVNFERSLVAEGTVLIKFWIEISQQEQLKRFNARAENPFKQWKLTEEDWRNREKYPQYLEAIEEMLERTDHQTAPWHLIAAESKRFARVTVLETVNQVLSSALADSA